MCLLTNYQCFVYVEKCACFFFFDLLNDVHYCTVQTCNLNYINVVDSMSSMLSETLNVTPDSLAQFCSRK